MASPELDRLTQAVADEKTVTASAIALMTNLSQRIRDNADNPTALAALADELDANKAALAQAIIDNTPAA